MNDAEHPHGLPPLGAGAAPTGRSGLPPLGPTSAEQAPPAPHRVSARKAPPRNRRRTWLAATGGSAAAALALMGGMWASADQGGSTGTPSPAGAEAPSAVDPILAEPVTPPQTNPPIAEDGTGGDGYDPYAQPGGDDPLPEDQYAQPQEPSPPLEDEYPQPESAPDPWESADGSSGPPSIERGDGPAMGRSGGS